MWETKKCSRQTGYEDLDRLYREHHPPSSSSSSYVRASNILPVMVTLLCLTSIIGIIAMTYRSFTEPDVIVIPINDLEKEMTPVLEITKGGGWSRQSQGRLGKLPPPNTPDPKWDPEPSESDLGLFDYAAVSVDSIPCAKIGK